LPSFFDTTTFIVAAYLVAACIGALASGSAWRRGRRLEAAAWAGIVLLLLGIAMIRELDLLHYAGGRVREFAAEGGWYDHRRPLQRLAIRAIVVGSVLAACFGGVTLRREGAAVVAAFLASTYVVGLLAVRAVSLHDVDIFMVGELIGLTRARGMELPGLAVIGVAAVVAALTWRGPARATKSG